MYRATALAVVALALAVGLGACGSGGSVSPSEAAARAGQALSGLHSLQAKVDALQARASAQNGVAKSLAARLDKLSHQLSASMDRFKASIVGIRSASDKAAQDAAGALSSAGSAARQIAVLTQRFDYHLRHSGGQ
jgi:uncharacterized lipoprotein YehR (DUF1307 family)